MNDFNVLLLVRMYSSGLFSVEQLAEMYHTTPDKMDNTLQEIKRIATNAQTKSSKERPTR